MELNVNSLHARIFRWVLFVSKDKMPKTLCPYFWKSVLMWLFMAPLLVMGLPIRLIRTVTKQGITLNYVNFSTALTYSILIYGGIFVVYCMVFFMYCLFSNVSKEYVDANEFLIYVGFISWFILIIVGIVTAWTSIDKYYERKKWEKYDFNKPEKKNVIIESVKGIYSKYCPRIDWKE